MSTELESFIQNGFRLCKEAKRLAENGELESANKILEANMEQYGNNIEWIILAAIIANKEKNYKKIKDILIPQYSSHEWNFDVNFYLGLACAYENQYQEMAGYLSRCLIHKKLSGEMAEEITNFVEEIYKKEPMIYDYFSSYQDRENQITHQLHCLFPDKAVIINDNMKKRNMIGDKFSIGKEEYYCAVYDRYYEQRGGFSLYGRERGWMLYKTEVLKGKKKRKFSIHTNEETVIAIMPLKNNQKITVWAEGEILSLDNLLADRYYYYKFEKNTDVDIASEESFVMSRPIELVRDEKKPRVIISVFVDGLSQAYLDDMGLDKIMPNTYSFFEKGTICTNAYSNGEWTYPSLASTFAGRHTLGEMGHRIFHPKFCSENLYKMELFPEILQREGYFCSKFDGEWRSTPNMGYAKGMDRILYQASVKNMFCDDVFMDMVEHLESFKEKNNFIWMEFPDLHDIGDEYESTTSTQVHTPFEFRKIIHTAGTSVKRGNDLSKAARYGVQVKRIDTFLGMLYSYLQKNYREDEYIITLMSDHGQGFLIPDQGEFFDKYRNKVGLMFRGNKVPKGKCTEFVENVDIFPTMLHCAGITQFDIKEGNIPKWFGGKEEREYAFTESVHPDGPYYAVLNNAFHRFYFTTKKNCSDEGYVDITDYTVKLENKDSSKCVTQNKRELIEKYTDIVLRHIKNYVTEIE